MAGRKGQRKQVPAPAASAIARMWNSMRQLRQFSVADLQATAEVGHSHATKYVRLLLQAQYLVLVAPKREGVAMGHAVYRLVRNTGPVAPRASADGVFDANLADPYQMPPTKRLCRHVHALHKALREIVDVCAKLGDEASGEEYDAVLGRAQQVLALVDGEPA
jgi:hypothetical protein